MHWRVAVENEKKDGTDDYTLEYCASCGAERIVRDGNDNDLRPCDVCGALWEGK